MRFTKMHGAGNDYVYVNLFTETLPGASAGGSLADVSLAELARRVADRHVGVGGDGLVLFGPSEVADARMRMFNADGSEAEMCGNAIRCVAKYLYDHDIARRETLRIETGAGVLTLQLFPVAGRVERVRVDMGEPILAAERIPTNLPGDPQAGGRVVLVPAPAAMLDRLDQAGGSWREACGFDPRMTCVSMGNPHVVFYVADAGRVPLERIGPVLEHDPLFPRRINVHVVQVHTPGEVTMRTWERGSGITLACGTGAAAVCVAGVLAQKSARQILAHLPGGDLELAWQDDNHVYKTGPAVEVFSGEWKAGSGVGGQGAERSGQ